MNLILLKKGNRNILLTTTHTLRNLKNELDTVKEREQKYSADNNSHIAQLEKELTTLEQRIANMMLLEENELHPHLINQPTPTTTYDVQDKTSGCVRLSTQAAGHAKYRIVVYQKQGGQQLVDILVHYLQALTYDEIIVIANEDGDVLEDTPMYKEFMLKGIHL